VKLGIEELIYTEIILRYLKKIYKQLNNKLYCKHNVSFGLNTEKNY